ncbi:MAG: hypothetical protein FWD88_05355 [Treponema sp.]|nr:hypothetical protein [Treponema sp.]
MVNGKIGVITVLLALAIGSVALYAQDRRVAVIPREGVYALSNSSYEMRLNWSNARGTAGTFHIQDRNNRNNNWARGTYTLNNGVLVLRYDDARGTLSHLRNTNRDLIVHSATELRGGNEIWRL